MATPNGSRDFPPAGFQPYVQPGRHPVHPKQASHFEGFPTRAHVLCLSITCAVCSENRTHCAGHVEFHTTARLENPSIPDPLPAYLLSVAGSATFTACVYGLGFTCADAHVAALCEARHGPHARCCANPARFPIQLRPLLGLCPSVAVVVSIPPTHTCVSRRSHSIP